MAITQISRTSRSKILAEIESRQFGNAGALPNTDDPQFLRYIIKSVDKFEDIDWDVMKSVYNRAVENGDIKL